VQYQEPSKVAFVKNTLALLTYQKSDLIKKIKN